MLHDTNNEHKIGIARILIAAKYTEQRELRIDIHRTKGTAHKYTQNKGNCA